MYSATDLPPDRCILLHQEMAYLDEVPDYVAFYCQEPAEHGQKTNLIGDMRTFTEGLPESFTRRFRGKRARLRRRLPHGPREQRGLHRQEELAGVARHRRSPGS